MEYKVVKEIAKHDDKDILLVEDNDGLYVLKIFKKTCKLSLYENLAKLSHKNMTQINKVFKREDSFCVAEEYIEGQTIQEMLEKNGAVHKNIAHDIFLQLCDVLAYLHERDIIHRDITPANIMLTADGTVKLLDFDIAREYKTDAPTDTEIMGTKPFAPPEQYGFAQSSGKTDIYALGVLMTAMLTNSYDATRISDNKCRKIVTRCTEFNPNKRYKNVNSLRRDFLYGSGGKKILLCFITAAMAAIFAWLLLLSPMPSTPTMPAVFLYSLAHDSHIQTLPHGTVGSNEIFAESPFLTSAGSAMFSIVANPLGGNAINLTNRRSNYAAIDLVTPFLEWDFANNTYLLTVHGYLSGGGIAIIAGADHPWHFFTSEYTYGNFTLQVEITTDILAEAGARRQLRIQSVHDTGDLTIHAISVARH
ncbi:MAG: serine/threonine protein kinase [Defluviitaleaceae bacterium]|nr:serine/threonine protein kinase [Defluviitaleaceae bacterium]